MHSSLPRTRVLTLIFGISFFLLLTLGAVRLVRVGAASATIKNDSGSLVGDSASINSMLAAPAAWQAAANDVVWVNPVDGNWNTAANWRDGNGVNRVPGASDNAIIIVPGTYTVTLNVNASVSTLTLGGSSGTQTLTNSAQSLTLGTGSVIGTNGAYTHGGGSLTITGTLTIDGNLTQTGGNLFGVHTFTGAGAYNWMGGALRGGGGITTIASGMKLNISGAADKTLLHGSSGTGGHRLVNNGTITWTGTGNIRAGDASTITNQTGGLFDAQSDASFIYAGFGNAVSFTNQAGATLRKSGGTGATNFAQFSLNNSGMLDVQTGTLTFNNVSASHVFNDGTTITGAGAVVINGADPTFTGTININGTLELAPAGSIAGIHTFTGTGVFNWTGGDLRGGGSVTTIASGFLLNMSGAANKRLLHGSSGANGHRLVNNGTINWTGTGNISAGDASTITNQTGGIFNVQNDASFIYAGFGNAVSFTNQAGATFRKSAGGGNTVFARFNFTNSGVIDVQTGALVFNDVNGSHTLNNGTQLTGAGLFLLDGADMTLGGTININGTFEQRTGQLFGTHTLTGTGVFNWTGGSMRGTGTTTVAPNFSLNISGATAKSLLHGGTTANGHKLLNSGTITWTGAGNIQAGDGSFITNQAGGLFDVQTDAALTYLFANAVSFTNAAGATFRKSAGTGTTSFSANFNFSSSGEVSLQSGTLSESNGFTQSGGTINLNGGNLAAGGTIILSNGATLGGSGTITANISNQATVNVGNSPGCLNVTGNYTQTAAGVLNVEIGGTTPCTQFDRLAISGTAALAGMLNATLINGYTPPLGQTFQVLTYASRTGTFTNTTGPFTVNHNATDVTLVSTSSITIEVTTTADSGAGSLRQAIIDSNNTAGTQTIAFNIPGAGPHIIALSSRLPDAGPVVIDGYTQPGASVNTSAAGSNAVLKVAITGPNTNSGATLRLFGGNGTPGSGSTVRGLAFDVGGFETCIGIFDGDNNEATAEGGHVIAGNFIGTDVTGSVANSAQNGGLFIQGTQGDRVGGPALADRNLFADLSGAITVAGTLFFGSRDTLIQNNLIGTNAAGTAALANGRGVSIEKATGVRVLNNVISGNAAEGINLRASADAVNFANNVVSNVTIQGNIVGLDAVGGAALPNGTGIALSTGGQASPGDFSRRVENVQVGGNTPAQRNIISGNSGNGIQVSGLESNQQTVFNTVIEGNYIGLDATGALDRGNGASGVGFDAFGVRVGGPTRAQGNIISGNEQFGIGFGAARDITIQNNFIGTSASGSSLVANRGVGIRGGLFGRNGQNIDIADNVISGHVTVAGVDSGAAIHIQDSTVPDAAVPNPFIRVRGNYIGTNASGTAALPNENGVLINQGGNWTIGGMTAADRNVISGNTANAVFFFNANPNHVVAGNYIGVGADGSTPLGNGGSGVTGSGSNIRVGGTTADEANIIANNGGSGVSFGGGAGNRILGNSIFNNTALGINLVGGTENAAGVTANDANDADTGTNNLQNFPLLMAATAAGGVTNVRGTLNSTVNTQFLLEFYANAACDTSGNGEGQFLLGSTTVMTDAAGNTSFNLTMPVATTLGQAVTATATDPAGNTSEFSQCRIVASGDLTISGQVTDASGAGLSDVTMTLSGPGSQSVQTDASGNYSFDVIAGLSYTVLPTSPYFVFSPLRADFANLASSQVANFSVLPDATPTPTPPLQDDFNAAERDPEKWNFGTLTQPASAFDPLVTVVQQGGRLIITPRDNAPGLSFNGYVSIRSYDFTGGQVSVEVVKAAGGTFAETSFAIGTDLQNYYRFVVMTAGSAPESVREMLAKQVGGWNHLSAQMLVLVFQVKINGVLTQQAIPYDPVQLRYWRFRHDPPVNSILFETSGDNVAYVERFRQTLEKGVSALTVELSAGTTAPSTGTSSAIFDNLSLVTNSAQFAASDYQVSESDVRATITVTRSGNVAASPATLTYRTEDTDTFTVGCFDATGNRGSAYARCDFATAIGTLSFAPGEVSKTFTVPLIDDGFAEGPETFQLRLTNTSGAALGAPALIRVTIMDNDAQGAPNPVVTSFPFFVRQQYLDFLSREPDQDGFNAWLGLLNGCPNAFNGPNVPSQCDRIFVSGEGFFRSVEFQLKGFYVFRFYKVGLNRLPEYLEVVSDMSFVAGLTAEEVYARKAELATLFTERAEFKAAYAGMTNVQYVTALLTRYGLTQVTTPDPAQPDTGGKVTLSAADLTSRLATGAMTRAQVLRAIADSDAVGTQEFNNAFVGMQYYGYLRRKPDPEGFAGWLRVLQSGDVRTMVNGFLNSTEYKLRFGQP